MEKPKKIIDRIWGRAHKTDQNQWKVIAMCVLAATTFWFFSALNKRDYTTNIKYPVSWTYPGKDSLLVIGELPGNITINVTGDGWSLFRKSLGVGVKPVEINLENPTQSRFLLGSNVTQDISEQVKSFDLNRVITDTLHLHIEPKLTRTVHLMVHPDSLDLAPGYILVGAAKVEPDTLQITGPASYVIKFSDTVYLKIPELNLNGDYRSMVELPVDDKELQLSSDEVLVDLRVQPLVTVEKEISVTTRNFPQDYDLVPEDKVVRVSYEVPQQLKDSLPDEVMQVFVDFDWLTEDSTLIPQIISNHQLAVNPKSDRSVLAVGKNE